MKFITAVFLTLGLLVAPALVFAAEAAVIDTDAMTMIVGLWSVLNPVEKALAVVWLLSPVASLIVSITPTPNDNRIVGKLYKVVDYLAMNFLFAKQKPNDPFKIDSRGISKALK
mgnify:FL=1|jgi:hypothetical protein|tara:strand:+ start:83 stop:424 length:342 start_codon:yes stop_codon:yes gene_type:complete